MPIDGCFIHYLTDELNKEILNYKINKIHQPAPLEVVLQLRGKNETGLIVNKQLLISSKLDSPRIHLLSKKISNPEVPNNFCMLLRKYIERGIISKIIQHENDRLIELHITAYNELDDENSFILIFEIMGRNSNIILLNSEFTIIDALRKLPPSFDNLRTIIPHAKYRYPESLKSINPFLDDIPLLLDGLQGISKQLMHSLNELNHEEIKNFLNQQLQPVIYKTEKKLDFYAYPLSNEYPVISHHLTLSNMMENYYNDSLKTVNYNAVEIEKTIQKEAKKATIKYRNLQEDLEKAYENIKFSNIGILLQSNLYKVKKGDKSIVVNDYFNNNEEIEIILNPLLDPSANLLAIFNKAKKASNAIVEIKKQIDKVALEIEYLNTILFQLSIADNTDLEQIKQELVLNGYIKSNLKNRKKPQKLDILSYRIEDVIIYIGKNNTQNDYLTHKIASSNDYWFHAQKLSGSHVIVKVPENNPNYEMNELIIRTAANLAAYYSTGQTSSSVPVDYTKVRYLKKVPGMKGSFVTMTNQKTIYIDPDLNLIKNLLK
jgi:predicted ribosome quality control (RQC) complex YloA/Tae2 family protein